MKSSTGRAPQAHSPTGAEIALYDQIISQLDRELIHSKETERYLTFAISGINGPQSDGPIAAVEGLKEMNCLLNESLQRKIDELNEYLL